MKNTVVFTEPEKKFYPIELTLTFETMRELEAFIALFNASGISMAKFANNHLFDDIKPFESLELKILEHGTWQKLRDTRNELRKV